MKKQILRILCLALALVLCLAMLTACRQAGYVQYLTDPARVVKTEGEVAEPSAAFRAAMADFAFDLLSESRDIGEGNSPLVSPLSVMLALTMTAGGAQGETLAQMEQVLGGGMPLADLRVQLTNYIASLPSHENARFDIANAIWVTSSPTFHVEPTFLQQVEQWADADVMAADMGDRATVDAINDWVKEQTGGMIDKILNRDDVSPDTIMVLLNALAFDALWANQPYDEDCFKDDFLSAAGETQRATYMWADGGAYIEGEMETGVVKYYKGPGYAFVALLPNEGISTDDYVSSLTGERFLELYDGRLRNNYQDGYMLDVRVKMPHFSTDYNVSLADVLQTMGMQDVFDPTAADLSGLGYSDQGNIFVSQVIHKTHLDLDNSGTRAAAVTAVPTLPTAADPSDNILRYRIELDRPFVYAIVDTQTGLPLFLGICESVS